MKTKITKINANGNSFIIIKDQALNDKFLTKKSIQKIYDFVMFFTIKKPNIFKTMT